MDASQFNKYMEVQIEAQRFVEKKQVRIQCAVVVVVVNHCFTSLFGTNGLLREIQDANSERLKGQIKQTTICAGSNPAAV